MFSVDEYSAIAPPLTPELLRTVTLPDSVIALEYELIGVILLLENVSICPAIVTLLPMELMKELGFAPFENDTPDPPLIIVELL